VTIREALKKYAADEIRFHFLKRHYRDSFDYSPASLNSSKEEFKVIERAARNAPRNELGLKKDDAELALSDQLSKARQEFEAAMDDDLDTPKALAQLWKVAEGISPEKSEVSARVFWEMTEALGFKLF
jgi:cysteinyl-tRNA synthetase